MSITIDLFDVAHGACSVITAPNGRRMMIDCGHNADRPWRPSDEFGGQEIELLIVSNLDEDHVSDLSNLMDRCRVKYIARNTSIGSGTLEQLKAEHGMGDGIARFQKWLRGVENKSSSGSSDFGSMTHRRYFNRFGSDFEDENNLSVVTFVDWLGFRIVFPGDLEIAGWKKLLLRSDFNRELNDTIVFVASHHGRQSGCCKEVFADRCPQVVLISDRDKQFDSQETVPWYASRCAGIPYGNTSKHVFTTRSNGDIRINCEESGWSVETER